MVITVWLNEGLGVWMSIETALGGQTETANLHVIIA
jgi:hypothetical protein